jgi:hypothetical protein
MLYALRPRVCCRSPSREFAADFLGLFELAFRSRLYVLTAVDRSVCLGWPFHPRAKNHTGHPYARHLANDRRVYLSDLFNCGFVESSRDI